MKHNLKITLIILAMFVITQFIGLYVTSYYGSHMMPYGLSTPTPTENVQFYSMFSQIIIAFIIAILLIFILAELKIGFLLKLWFFVVVSIALGIAFTSIFPSLKYISIFSLILAAILSYIKIFKRNIIIHNLTELLIYPGIASLFVPILNLWTTILFLILISLYDMWAVWKSGIMQKMAKYQIDHLGIFSGFFIPYLSKSVKMKIRKMKKSDLKKKKVKANVAILGGGDVVFPIIASGVMYSLMGLVSALFVILGATLGLTYLFFFAKKKKFYPAMPFITAGILLAIGLSYLIL